MKKILLAPNSFKQCADSVRISEIFRNYLSDVKNLEIIDKPISDGGDGFVDVCSQYFNATKLTYEISTSYNDSLMSCDICIDENSKTAFIESANILGLKRVPYIYHKPMFLTSKGMGDLLIRINNEIKNGKHDIEKIVIGIGGTATNDLGLGMCSRFNLELIDIFNKKMEITPENYYRIKQVSWDRPELNFQIEAVLDVVNPLIGKMGATRTFGKQKGLDRGEIEVLELGFTKILHKLEGLGILNSEESLYGAGGGLAAGLQIFFDAKTKTAEDFILNDLGINKVKDQADFIITGEGAFDLQTQLGKGAGIILKLFEQSDKKVFLCCGSIDENVKQNLSENIYPIELSKYFNTKEESIKNYEQGIAEACKEIKKAINS